MGAQVSTRSSDLAASRGCHHLVPPGYDHLLEQCIELRGTGLFTSLLKALIRRQTNRPVKKYIGRGRGRSGAGASVPVDLGCITLLVHSCVHQPGSSLNPLLLGFYGGFLTEVRSILHPLWRVGVGLLMLACSFCDRPPQEPTQNQTYSQCSHLLGIYNGLRSSVSGTRARGHDIGPVISHLPRKEVAGWGDGCGPNQPLRSVAGWRWGGSASWHRRSLGQSGR